MNNTVYFGDDSVSELRIYLEEFKEKKIFLVTGKKSYEKCGAKSMIDELLINHSYIRYSDFDVNPKIEDVIDGIKLFKSESCELTIAIGGGSVIDCGKLINSLSHIDDEKLIAEYIIKNINTPKKSFFFAIPTTAGAGSESTHFAVVYLNNKKYSFANQNLLPDKVFIIPKFTYSLSKYQFACSAADALCQSIESFWAVNSNSISKEYARQGIEIIYKNIIDAVVNEDRNARKEICKGANLAGKAINISKTTGPHAISYPFTNYFNLPHGHAVTLSLSFFINYNYSLSEKDCNDTRGVEYVKENMSEICSLFGVNDINELSNKIKNLFNQIGLNQSLEQLNLMSKHKINKVIKNINFERANNNPRIIQPNIISDHFLNGCN
jgi:alcohol dehydrogenase